jgi:hypothetical protein
MEKKLIRTIAGLLLTATPAAAQSTDARPLPSPQEQALGSKVLIEVKAGLQCGTDLITAEREIAKLQARIRELEPKAPKPESDPK